jgi:hypothetical protein
LARPAWHHQKPHRRTRRDNVIAVGNSGTGKTHIALGLGLAACQKGLFSRLHHRGRYGPRPHLARAHAELGQFEAAWRCIGEAMTAAETGASAAPNRDLVIGDTVLRPFFESRPAGCGGWSCRN